MKRALAAAFVVLFAAASARADDADAQFAAASQALARNAPREAIELFEGLADGGAASADASFDRGLAYVARARSNASEPGDLGRAAAAFEEALVLRPNDADAEHALDTVRGEIARRRGREGSDPDAVDEGPTAWSAVVSLASEETWSILSAFASVVLTIGLVLRGSSKPRVRLGSGVATALGLLFLVAFALPAFSARQMRRHTSLAVVAAPDARWVDEHGLPLPTPPIPEGARVDVVARAGSIADVRWGKRAGFVSSTALRVVRPAEDSE